MQVYDVYIVYNMCRHLNHEPSPLHLRQLKSQHQGNYHEIHHPPLSSPLDGFCLGEWCYHHSSPCGPLTLPSMGFLFPFIVDSHSWSSVLPLTRHLLYTSLRFLHGRKSLLLRLLSALLSSKPLAKYFNLWFCLPCRATLRSLSHGLISHSAVRKSLAAVAQVSNFSRLGVPSFPPSWSSSRCSITATSTPLAGILLPPWLAPYCSILAWLTPYCCSPAVDLRSLYENTPRLHPSFWPSLMPFWHSQSVTTLR